jgi:hypothetical protein
MKRIALILLAATLFCCSNGGSGGGSQGHPDNDDPTQQCHYMDEYTIRVMYKTDFGDDDPYQDTRYNICVRVTEDAYNAYDDNYPVGNIVPIEVLLDSFGHPNDGILDLPDICDPCEVLLKRKNHTAGASFDISVSKDIFDLHSDGGYINISELCSF